MNQGVSTIYGILSTRGVECELCPSFGRDFEIDFLANFSLAWEFIIIRRNVKRLFFALFVLALAPNLALAYLDPGSGSLLLSSIVALFASAAFFVKNLFYKIISFGTYNPLSSARSAHSTGGGSTHKNLAFYSEGAQYYGTFKPILDALDSLKHPYAFYTSSPDDPALKRLSLESISHPVGEFIYIGQGNKAYTFLNRLRADILVMTTPGLDVLHIKRNRGVRHYCHIVHSLTPMTYRVFGVDYFDSVLVANDIQRKFVRDVEAAHDVKTKFIAITGSPYLDELYTKSQKIAQDSATKPNATKTILISPSWGKESLLSKYGLKLLLPLAKSGFSLIIRPHPQSFIGASERENLESLQAALAEYSNVEWDKDTPNVYAFSRADMMISDFSSVIFDFVCLEGKPVLTIDNEMDLSGYDMADLERESIWTFKALDRIGGRVRESDFERIGELCQKALDSGDFGEIASNIQAVRSELWQHAHDAGMKSALALLKIERELIESRLRPQIGLVERLRALDVMLSASAHNKGHSKGYVC